MALIGYARVSTEEQNLDMQRRALREAHCDVVLEDDGHSAVDLSRPGFVEALNILSPGDILVIWKMDRAFRSAKQAINIFDEFEEKGYQLRCLTEPIDTSTSFGKSIFQIRNVFAELERNIIRERTIAGMQAARARGVKIGRPRKLSASHVEMAREKLKSNPYVDRRLVAQEFGVSVTTLMRSINRLILEGDLCDAR